jgi:Tfp pilus assembly protein PilO
LLFAISGIKNRLESAHRALANQGQTLADLSKRHERMQQQLALLNKQLYECSERYCCSDRTDCIMKTIELCSSNAITIKSVTPIKERTKSWHSTTTISYGLEGQFKDIYALFSKLPHNMLLTIKNISMRSATNGLLDVICVCTYWHIKRDLYA